MIITGPVVLAIDIGGTSIKAALVDPEGHRVREHVVTTPTASGPTAVTQAVREVACRLASEADPENLLGAGVITPGIVDRDAGLVKFAANLGWHDLPLARLLADEIGVDVQIEHDVRAACIAEATLGRARGETEAAYLSIGTGIAIATITRGEICAGVTRSAGEMGHLCVCPDGERCVCGQLGCLEAYASGASIARRYAAAGGVGRPAEDIVRRLDTDPVARQVWQDAVVALAAAITAYTTLLDPAVVLFGGGIAAAADLLLTPLRENLAQRLSWRPPPRLEPSAFGADGGRVGAAILGWRAAGHDFPSRTR